MQASIVIGLGWGDEGKGVVTNFLTNSSTIVVRFNGGHQAGHTVVTEKGRHVFGSYGAGTLKGAPTYFGEECIIYPNVMNNERLDLYNLGIKPKLYVHPLTKVTTPYDVAFNKLMEKRKGHGSCGMGIGATMERNKTGYKLYTMDLKYPAIALKKLEAIKDYYKHICFTSAIMESQLFSMCKESEEYFISLLQEDLFEIKDYDILTNFQNVVFEGAQGIMLDMDHGIFPNVTYSNTSSKNTLLGCMTLDAEPEIYYVTRCYQTRHGNGWMSNSDPITLVNNQDETNVKNEFQGSFRVGELDYDLLNYALDVDNLHSSGYKKNIIVTCMDQRPDFTFDFSKLNTKFEKKMLCYSEKGDIRIVGELQAV